MENRAKAVLQWENKEITIEGPCDFVERMAKILRSTDSKPLESEYLSQSPQSPSPASLVAEKKPKGHHEVVAVLAFRLLQEGQEEFTEQDIKRAYIQANIRPPKVIAQSLRDAKNKFDYLESTKERGVYRLSPHGDRTVRFDMPR